MVKLKGELLWVQQDDAQKVLSDLHDGPIGRHYGGDTIAQKFFKLGSNGPHYSKMHMHMHEIKSLPNHS